MIPHDSLKLTNSTYLFINPIRFNHILSTPSLIGYTLSNLKTQGKNLTCSEEGNVSPFFSNIRLIVILIENIVFKDATNCFSP